MIIIIIIYFRINISHKKIQDCKKLLISVCSLIGIVFGYHRNERSTNETTTFSAQAIEKLTQER